MKIITCVYTRTGGADMVLKDTLWYTTVAELVIMGGAGVAIAVDYFRYGEIPEEE